MNRMDILVLPQSTDTLVKFTGESTLATGVNVSGTALCVSTVQAPCLAAS